MNFCPLHQAFVPFDTDYPVDVKTDIPVEERSFNAETKMPPMPPNGGLYGGEQAVGPHASIPVTPTVTNYIYYNLRSANPPPGAIHQFIGTNRLGNNYVAMPGVYWLNDKSRDMDNRYRIKVVHDKFT